MDGLTGIVIIIAVVEAIIIAVLVARSRVTPTTVATPVTRSARNQGPAVCGACGQPMPKGT